MAFALWRQALPGPGASLRSGRGPGAMVQPGRGSGKLAAIAGNAEQSKLANTPDLATR